MDPCETSKLALGTAVWIWIVRQGEGQWCPGTVQSLAAPKGVATVTVRFECHSLRRNSSRPATFIGISTTQMKHLENVGYVLKEKIFRSMFPLHWSSDPN